MVNFTHILRHAWFWPIEFWMRPLMVIDRFKKDKSSEFFAALLGSGLWGALISLWLINGDVHSIWVTAGAETGVWGIFLAFFLSIGIIANFFSDNYYGLWRVKKN
ncbi:MAG: hypothetical protein ABFS56_34950, partial [Pseudomonadota bacterium]